jgi:hypothetical protein
MTYWYGILFPVMQKYEHRTTNQDMNTQNSRFLDNTDMNSTDYRQRLFHIYTP